MDWRHDSTTSETDIQPQESILQRQCAPLFDPLSFFSSSLRNATSRMERLWRDVSVPHHKSAFSGRLACFSFSTLSPSEVPHRLGADLSSRLDIFASSITAKVNKFQHGKGPIFAENTRPILDRQRPCLTASAYCWFSTYEVQELALGPPGEVP